MFHAIRRGHVDQVIGVLLLAAVVAALIWTGASQAHQNSVNACQRRVNAAFQVAIAQRSAETRKSNQALERLVDAISGLRGTPAQRAAAWRRDVAAWKQAIDATQAIPLPAPATKTCDG